ncbi:MAG: flavodoxin domain-containing protein, partial [Chloroflexota bacterium]|nr:flavodoxin domain-containing protein [Chloroflexota bacterium]
EVAMGVLVAVASKHGSTREIAEVIAEELRTQGLEVDLRDAGQVDALEGYDAVVLGSGIYAGSWLPEAKHFADQHRGALTGLPVWLFSSGPLGAPEPKPHDDPAKLAAPMGDVPIREHRVFVGKLDPADLSFGERLIARVVHAPSGDFRDWEDVSGWARRVAAELQATAP